MYLTSIVEIIPLIESLPHADKFKLMQLLLTQLAKEEGIPLPVSKMPQSDPLWDIIGMAEGGETDLA